MGRTTRDLPHVMRFWKIKQRRNLTRWQMVGLVVAGIVGVVVVGIAWMLYQFAAHWPTSNTVTARINSPDGAYVATVTDWNTGGLGGGSNLEIKPSKTSGFAARFRDLFKGTYTDSFEQVEGIQWTDKRTLKVKYLNVPGEGNHLTSWGDVHLDYGLVSVR